jgi:hypothetical protein
MMSLFILKTAEKQDMQSAYNVILRGVQESLLPWKSNKLLNTSVWMCVRARAPGLVGACVNVRGACM